MSASILAPGETLGVVGESGAGKSTIAKALLGVLPRTVRITQGEILFEGRDLRTMPRRETRAIFGDAIALVPQDPMTALNPGRRIEAQLTDGLRLRRGMNAHEAHKRALELLAEVHIQDPERVLRSYPHQLSGGMRQRVLIAAAFALEPKIIVADEPTTALDVTVQKQILRLIRAMQEAHRTAVIFVTHDLGVVAQICDRVTLLFAGAVVESGLTADILSAPRHAYTRALIAAGPRYDRPDAGLKPVPEALVAELQARNRGDGPLGRDMAQDLLVASGVEVAYGGKRRLNGERVGGVKVLHGVDLRIGRGETVGIVGEFGLRQDNARARAHAAHRHRCGQHRFRREGHHATAGAAYATLKAAHADDFPGPDDFAQSAPHGPAHPGRAASLSSRRARSCRRRASGAGVLRSRRAAARLS